MLKSKYIFSIIVLYCTSLHTFGQYEALLHKPYPEKLSAIDSLYHQLNNLHDIDSAKKMAQTITAYGKKNKDKEIRLEADLFLANYIKEQYKNNKDSVALIVNSFQQVATKAEEKKVLQIELRALMTLAEYYWLDLENYEMAFETYIEVDRLLKGTGYHTFPNRVQYYKVIGERYYFFRDYTTAINFLKLAVKAPTTPFSLWPKWAAYNTIGLCFQKINQLDSSDYYFAIAAGAFYKDDNDIHNTISNGNIGYNQYLRGNYHKAVPLIKKDWDNAIIHQDYGLAAGAGIPLADILIHQNKLDEAWQYLRQSKQYIEQSGQQSRYIGYYKTMKNWYLAKNNHIQAIQYQDSATKAVDDDRVRFNAIQLLRAQQKSDKQEIEASKLKLSLLRQNSNLKILFLIIILFSIIALAIVLINSIRKKNLARQRAKEEELQQAQTKLAAFAKDITDKNNIIERLQQLKENVENTQYINELRQSTVLTEDDWNNFLITFDKAYNGYFLRLKSKVPGITPAETRMVMLSKLKLSHREMAEVLAISPQSSRITWHRMRKKINLNESVSLEQFAEEV